MNPNSTVTSGLHAALRLARGRSDGVVLVEGNPIGAATSFWSIAFCIPSVVCRLLMVWAETGVPSNAAHDMGRELIVFILGWLVFVEASYRLAPLFGRSVHWERFVAVWNWCNVVEGVLVVAGGLPALVGAPSIIGEACELITIGWALWLEWYATRLALGVGSLTACWLVLLDQAVGIVLAALAVSISS